MDRHPTSRLIGQKFGKLTVVERVGSDRDRNATWLCQCTCGNTKIVAGKYLKRGNNTSCGCSHTHARGVAIRRMWYELYRRGALKRGLAFELSQEKFFEIAAKDCVYCGEPPRERTHLKLNGGVIMNGLDRVDSAQGYEIHNVVPCCKYCNVMKSNLSLDEFRAHIQKIHVRLCSGTPT